MKLGATQRQGRPKDLDSLEKAPERCSRAELLVDESCGLRIQELVWWILVNLIYRYRLPSALGVSRVSAAVDLARCRMGFARVTCESSSWNRKASYPSGAVVFLHIPCKQNERVRHCCHC